MLHPNAMLFFLFESMTLEEATSTVLDILKSVMEEKVNANNTEIQILERKEKDLTVVTDDELKLKQVYDLITTHFVRRKVDPLSLKEDSKEKAGGDKVRQVYKLNEGIEQVISKKITADIKSSKIKVQVKINGNELRVEGKKRDDLQAVMKMIEEAKVDIPIQFINFRE